MHGGLPYCNVVMNVLYCLLSKQLPVLYLFIYWYTWSWALSSKQVKLMSVYMSVCHCIHFAQLNRAS